MTLSKALSALALYLLLVASASAQTLYFSAIPDQDETALVSRFSKIADYLSSKLDVPVKYVPVKSYPAAVTAFRNDQIQLAWFGGLSGVQARLFSPGARAIAQGAEDRQFVTYFIANKSLGGSESKAFPVDLMRGKTFTFGARTSTSGRLMPEYYIRKKTGESPKDFFSRVGFSGDHTQTLRLVASGAWQVGALNYAVYEKAKREGAPEVRDATVIWKTPPFPDYNWTIRGDVDQRFGKGFSDRVQAALVSMTDPELLKSFPRSAFVPAKNADYDPVAKTGRALGLIE